MSQFFPGPGPLQDEFESAKAEITAQNDNITKLQEGIAIIVDGDTAALAVQVGAYAYVKNNAHGLTEGMYKNTSSSAFPVSGGTADSTVFTSVPSGVANELKNKITNQSYLATSNFATFDVNLITKSNIICAQFIVKPINTISSGDKIIEFPFSIPANKYLTIRKFSNNEFIGLAYTSTSGITVATGQYSIGEQYIIDLVCNAIN